METILKDFCYKCKTKDNLMPKPYSKGPYNKKGFRYGYRMCNACNTERMRKYYATESGRAAVYASTRHQYEMHTKRLLTYSKVKDAVKEGVLVKPSYCEECGFEKPLDGHHKDYNFPLQIDWLCRQCHAKLHYKLKYGI